MNTSCYPEIYECHYVLCIGNKWWAWKMAGMEDGGHGVGPLLFLHSCIEGGPIPAVSTPCHPTSSSFLGSATSWQ